MQLENDVKPIFIKIAEMIEDQILEGNIKEGEQVVSTTQLSKLYQINPATAGKGINILVDEGIIYKKRGVGMFVSEGAREQIRHKRKDEFFKNFIPIMIKEAERLGISTEDIIKTIKKNVGSD